MSLYCVTNGATGTINAYTAGAALAALDKLNAMGARPPSRDFNEFCRACDETIAIIDGLYASGSRIDASAAKRSFDASGKPVRRAPGFSPFEIARSLARFNSRRV